MVKFMFMSFATSVLNNSMLFWVVFMGFFVCNKELLTNVIFKKKNKPLITLKIMRLLNPPECERLPRDYN